MLPAHLIAEFWATVANELASRHHVPDGEIPRAISTYRAAMERHRVGDLVYHRDAEAVAETIAGGWETGFPAPAEQSRG
jgi:hypothetical protein